VLTPPNYPTGGYHCTCNHILKVHDAHHLTKMTRLLSLCALYLAIPSSLGFQMAVAPRIQMMKPAAGTPSRFAVGHSSVRGVGLPRETTATPLVMMRGVEADFDESITTGTNEGGVEAGAVAGEGVAGGLTAVYKFLRPHTIRGTILASVTGVG
jgi:hypothetical protein